MSEKPQTTKRRVTPDWLVQGVLTKIGDTFDRLLGRGWKPSSSLATSELIERLKALLDAEARETEDNRKFVPHNIKLKMQWDKFSTDSEEGLRKLEAELLTATVDHINDKRYYTHAPITLEVKQDYFTDGVKLNVSFDEADEDHEAEINVSIPGKTVSELLPSAARVPIQSVVFRFEINGRAVEKTLSFEQGRRFSVGRTKENDLVIDDVSVSKVHASLLLNSESRFVVADTGSTNGTFVNGERIAYGRAVEFEDGTNLKFGTVPVQVEFLEIPVEVEEPVEPPDTETYKIGDFEFTKRTEEIKPEDVTGAKTAESGLLAEPMQNLRAVPENEKG